MSNTKPKLLNKSDLCRLFDVDLGTLNRRIAHLEPLRANGRDKLYAVKDVEKIFAQYRKKKAGNQDLSDSKRARLASQVEALRERVTKSRAEYFDAVLLQKMRTAEAAFVKREVRNFVGAIKLPDDIAGLSTREVFRTVDVAIRNGLTKLGKTARPSIADDDQGDVVDTLDLNADLSKLDETQLLTLQNQLKSMSIDIVRLRRNGTAASVTEWSAKVDDALLRTRTALLGVAGRIGALASSASVGDLYLSLHELVENALTELDKDALPAPSEDFEDAA